MRDFTDSDLVERLRGDRGEEAERVLIDRYKPIAAAISRTFPMPGVDPEDTEAEAFIKLCLAIRSYVPGAGSSLKTWIRLTIKRHLMDRLDTATNGAQIPRSMTLSLDKLSGEGEISLQEQVAGAEDTFGDVAAESMTAEVYRAVERSWPVINDLAQGDGIDAVAARHDIGAEAVEDLILAVDKALAIGDAQEIAGKWQAIVGRKDLQDDLFGITEFIDPGARAFVGAAAFRYFRQLCAAVLGDVAAGYSTDEIVARYSLTRASVENLLSVTRSFVLRHAA